MLKTLGLFCGLLLFSCTFEPVEPSFSTNSISRFDGEWADKNGNTVLTLNGSEATFHLENKIYQGDFQEDTKEKYLSYRYFDFVNLQTTHRVEWYQSGNVNVIYSATLAGGFRENVQHK